MELSGDFGIMQGVIRLILIIILTSFWFRELGILGLTRRLSRSVSKSSSNRSFASSFKSSLGGGAKKALDLCPPGIGDGLKKLQGIGSKSIKSLSKGLSFSVSRFSKQSEHSKQSDDGRRSRHRNSIPTEASSEIPIEIPINTPVQLPASSCITISKLYPDPTTIPVEIGLPRCSCTASPRSSPPKSPSSSAKVPIKRSDSPYSSPRRSPKHSPPLPERTRIETPERLPTRLPEPPRGSPEKSSRSPERSSGSASRLRGSSGVSPKSSPQVQLKISLEESSTRRGRQVPSSPTKGLVKSPPRSPSERRPSPPRSPPPRPPSPKPSPPAPQASPPKARFRPYKWRPALPQGNLKDVPPAIPPPPSSTPYTPYVPTADPNDPHQRLYNELQTKLLGYFAMEDPPNKEDFKNLMYDVRKTQCTLMQTQKEGVSVKFLTKYCIPYLPSDNHVPLVETAELKQECMQHCHNLYGFVFIPPHGHWSGDLVDFFACGRLVPLTIGEASRDPEKAPYKDDDGQLVFGCDCKINPATYYIFDMHRIKIRPFLQLQNESPADAMQYMLEAFDGTDLQLISNEVFLQYIRAIARKWKLPDPDQYALHKFRQEKEAGGEDDGLADDEYWENMQFYRRPGGR